MLCCSCSAAFRRGGGRQKDACGIETRPVDSVTLDEHVCVYTSVYTRFFPARASFIRGIYVQTLLPCLRLGMLHSVGGGAQHAASATGSHARAELVLKTFIVTTIAMEANLAQTTANSPTPRPEGRKTSVFLFRV